MRKQLQVLDGALKATGSCHSCGAPAVVVFLDKSQAACERHRQNSLRVCIKGTRQIVDQPYAEGVRRLAEFLKLKVEEVDELLRSGPVATLACVYNRN